MPSDGALNIPCSYSKAVSCSHGGLELIDQLWTCSFSCWQILLQPVALDWRLANILLPSNLSQGQCSFSNHFFVHSICLSVCGFDQASIPKLLILLMLFSVTSWYSSATALQKVLRDLQTVFFGDFTLHPDYMNGTR